ALTGSTAGLHCWVALVGGQHWWGWAQVGGTGGQHWCVTLQSGTGGCTAGHRWAELVGALLGGTCGRHCWALIISALMIGADPRSDNCRFSAHVIGHR
ncbi:unnamed protein product, partial [Staurois parvus]